MTPKANAVKVSRRISSCNDFSRARKTVFPRIMKTSRNCRTVIDLPYDSPRITASSREAMILTYITIMSRSKNMPKIKAENLPCNTKTSSKVKTTILSEKGCRKEITFLSPLARLLVMSITMENSSSEPASKVKKAVSCAMR